MGICKVFLSKAAEYDPKKIEMLKALLAEFLFKCKFALTLNKRLIDEAIQGEYQRAMEESLKRLEGEAEQYLQ
jgi:hypothetical protein